MELKEQAHVTRVRTLELDDAAIRWLLAHQGYEVPESSSIRVSIPGGGDWSNMDLDITGGTPVKVSWKEVE